MVDITSDYVFDSFKEAAYDTEKVNKRGIWFKYYGEYRCGRNENIDGNVEFVMNEFSECSTFGDTNLGFKKTVLCSPKSYQNCYDDADMGQYRNG